MKLITGIAILATIVAVVAVVFWMSSGLLTSTCEGTDIPTAPIKLYTRYGSGELVFVVYFPSPDAYSPEQRIGNLSYEMALYPQGTDLRGPGNVSRSGSLLSLNTTGTLQFHDVEAGGWFTPSDFFILTNPPPVNVQLRVLHGSMTIAFNPLIGCA